MVRKMLLAALPDAEREAYLGRGPFVALTPATITDAEQLRVHLERVAWEGCALEHGETAEDLFPPLGRLSPSRSSDAFGATGACWRRW